MRSSGQGRNTGPHHLATQRAPRRTRGHRGPGGWWKHAARVLRRRKPDDLTSLIAVVLFCAAGLVALYFAGNVGLYAAVVLVSLVVFAIGLTTRGLKWVLRMARSRIRRP
jgi:hypothetical protein